jgi:hypothetical protein
MWVGAPLANSPCIAFGCTLPPFHYDSSCGCPSFQLTLPCIWAPNLAQAVLKKLSRSQNFSLSDIWLVFFPSAPLCGCFHYNSSCGWVPLFPTRLVLHLGIPASFSLRFLMWVPLLPTHLALCLGTQPCPVVLKNLIRSQNCSLSDIWLVFLPSAPLCGCFHAFHVGGHTSFQLTLRCVWAPCLLFITIPHVGEINKWRGIMMESGKYCWEWYPSCQLNVLALPLGHIFNLRALRHNLLSYPQNGDNNS